MSIHGGLQEIFRIIGNHLSQFWTNKPDYKIIQERGLGMTQTC
jgi:hypothetical protein